MKKLITNRGGTSKSTLKFVILGDYLKLIIDYDISLLNNITDYLSTNALDFFRLWYTHNHILEKNSPITHPRMWVIVKKLAK